MARARVGAIVAVALAAYVAYAVTSVVILVRLAETGDLNVPEVANTVGWVSSFLGLPAVGALLAIKRPANRVGWAILAAGAGAYVTLLPGVLVELQVVRTGRPGGAAAVAAAVGNAAWPLVIAAIAHIVLLFPDGVLERWGKVLSRTAVATASILVPLRLFRVGRLDLDLEVEVINPLGVASFPAGDTFVGPLTAVLTCTALAGVVRLVMRYRRAAELERKQFQWVLWSFAALPLLVFTGNAIETSTDAYWLGQLLTVLGFDVAFLGFAFALGRAVLKHDLYGIDRIVSRAVAYVGVTATLAAVYVGGVLGIGSLIPGGSSDLLVAGSTLVVAALFQPLRGRIQRVVDRRFNRARYDAEREVAALGGRLRREVAIESLAEELAVTVDRAVRPASVSITLLGSGARA